MPKFRSIRRFVRAQSCFLARIVVLWALAASCGVAPLRAEAHAIIVSAHPAMNATVAPGQLPVRIDFNSRIDRERSRLRLRRPDGSESPVSLAPGREPNVLAGNAEVGEAGRWKLLWQVLSIDGHITRGEVTFWVRDKVSAP